MQSATYNNKMVLTLCILAITGIPGVPIFNLIKYFEMKLQAKIF
jgi:hypothetical protein